MFFDDSNAIIVSSGHLNTYVGYASDEIPTYHGLSYYSNFGGQNQYLECLSQNLNRGARIHPLISNDKINSVDEYLKFVNCIITKFNDEISEHPIMLLNKNSADLDANRKQLTEILFEEYIAPCLYFGNEAVTGLFSTGSFNGILVDSGMFKTTITPIYDGCVLRKSNIIRYRKG